MESRNSFHSELQGYVLPCDELERSSRAHLSHSGIVLGRNHFKLLICALLLIDRSGSGIRAYFHVISSRLELGDAKVSVFVSLTVTLLLPNAPAIDDLSKAQSNGKIAQRFSLRILDMASNHGFGNQ